MRDEQLLEAIERYLSGDMGADERRAFEQLRIENAEVDQRVIEHQQFVGLLKQYGERVELETRLNTIHEEIDVHTLTEQVTERSIWIVDLWRNHHSKISMAASIAIFAILGTLFVTGKMDNNSTYQELNNKMKVLGTATNNLKQKVDALGVKVLPPDKYRGTGFAITGNGLIATAYHVIENSDSVYVQNYSGRSFKSTVLYVDKPRDVAILKIVDTSFKSLGAIPYTFKHSVSDLAESIYTYGYPENAPGYNAGWVTALSGLNNDSVDYQISIPVNPGSSGAPLFDSKGRKE